MERRAGASLTEAVRMVMGDGGMVLLLSDGNTVGFYPILALNPYFFYCQKVRIMD
ncbi:hypothetical protein CBFG_02180 [Clostridiales bacterium 1_7_47FAA]|nr:hypothetical protein CBFG_02180 [Clostridiales bacterium 1_7_47FAA]